MPYDPITASVIQAGLAAAADEMFAVLKKTAMSPIIYEVLDVGTGITDSEGELVSSGAGIPTFVGVLDKAVKRILELNRRDEIRDDDVFITNDPYYGGVTHLNDVVIALPVFARGSLTPGQLLSHIGMTSAARRRAPWRSTYRRSSKKD
jgi:N-methylhydantoinase B